MKYGVIWRLRLYRFEDSGWFVSVGARRTDFDLRRREGDLWNHVFATETDATAGGIAIYREYGRDIDVLLPQMSIAQPGLILAAKDANLRVQGKRMRTDEEWGSWLRRFAPWETSGKPDIAVRKNYNVHVERDVHGNWTVIDKEETPW